MTNNYWLDWGEINEEFFSLPQPPQPKNKKKPKQEKKNEK